MMIGFIVPLKRKSAAAHACLFFMGFSMSRLSRESNMAYKTIQTIWRDPNHEVTTTTLNKLARTLGVDPSELIEYIPEEK